LFFWREKNYSLEINFIHIVKFHYTLKTWTECYFENLIISIEEKFVDLSLHTHSTILQLTLQQNFQTFFRNEKFSLESIDCNRKQETTTKNEKSFTKLSFVTQAKASRSLNFFSLFNFKAHSSNKSNWVKRLSVMRRRRLMIYQKGNNVEGIFF
jgi:hypothetical protein